MGSSVFYIGVPTLLGESTTCFSSSILSAALFVFGYVPWDFHWKISDEVGNLVQPNGDLVLQENHLASVAIRVDCSF